MSFINGMPVNFTISNAAKSEIDYLRSIWPANTGEKAGILSIGWARAHYHNGKLNEFVMVSFYSETQFEEIKAGIETVSGLEVLFFITKENYDRFEGKILDYSAEQAFFLREPTL